MRLLRRFTAVTVLPLVGAAVACSGSDASERDDVDLTSLTGHSRSLRFDGYVYVDPGASDDKVLATVRSQTRTAFGALRNAKISVNSRELKDVDPASFKKTSVTMIDTFASGDVGTPMTKVTYRYEDKAVVPAEMDERSALPLALMSPRYLSKTKRVLVECTDNDEHARKWEQSIWYVFDPSLWTCRDAMAKEQAAIDEAQAQLEEVRVGSGILISKLEADRLYIPIMVSLGADETNKVASYPEYDRLFSGGVAQDKLVIGMVNGFIDHGPRHDYTDEGYGSWLEQLKESFAGRRFELKAIDPSEDLGTFKVNGAKVTGVSFDDILAWEVDGTGFPDSISVDDRDQLRRQVGDKLIHHWLTFEARTHVSIGGAPPKPFSLEIVTYFGAGTDPTPHRRAIKNSDVFLFNGHSNIGNGPLDPTKFDAGDFPSSYQILFIDACVSYNYYEKDYIPLKAGGTRNLDLVTNGIETPSRNSGYALGRFVSALVSGSQPSYAELLQAAEITDALRVVDGELDNAYDPIEVPIVMD